MSTVDIRREKSLAILELEAAKRSGASRRNISDLASRAAILEARWAEDLLSEKRGNDAAVSFLSAAACMKDAHRHAEAARLLNRASVYSDTAPLSSFIEQEQAGLDNQRHPGEIFRRTEPNIRDNARLRTPQREAYVAAQRHFRQSNEHAIIQLPVGCGKTGTMALLPFALAGGRTLVIAPNVEIRDTVSRNLDYSSPGCFYRRTGVLNNGNGPVAAVLDSDANLIDADGADFVISNIQQLAGAARNKWLDKLPPDYFDVVLVDEGHHNVAASWQDVFEQFPRARVTSFTATPLRSDGKEVEGRRIYHFPIAQAIREGYVRDLASRRLEPTEIFFEYQGSTERHRLEDVLRLREEAWFSKGVALSPTCNRHIVDASIQCMRELRQEGSARHQIIAAACSIDHAKSIRSLYSERNLVSDVIHSEMSPDELSKVRSRLAGGELDAIVQVNILGEGADYPNLGVAAIFRPYRHLVPYVQFIGRIMRVVRQDAPGHPDNRGYVVSHVGLNVERWWDDLKRLDQGDQLFFEELAQSSRSFELQPSNAPEQRRKYRHPMEVLAEVVERFVEVGFVPEMREAIVDDVVHALGLRGIDLETLGLDRKELSRRIDEARPKERIGQLFSVPVQPQRARQEARRRLNERVQSAASEVLRALAWSIPGYELPRLFPGTGSRNNIAAAIVLLNREVQAHLKTSSAERDLLSLEELEDSYRAMDTFVDAVLARVAAAKRGENAEL
jgi:superfamily II DNA or RNA helicase